MHLIDQNYSWTVFSSSSSVRIFIYFLWTRVGHDLRYLLPKLTGFEWTYIGKNTHTSENPQQTVLSQISRREKSRTYHVRPIHYDFVLLFCHSFWSIIQVYCVWWVVSGKSSAKNSIVSNFQQIFAVNHYSNDWVSEWVYVADQIYLWFINFSVCRCKCSKIECVFCNELVYHYFQWFYPIISIN